MQGIHCGILITTVTLLVFHVDKVDSTKQLLYEEELGADANSRALQTLQGLIDYYWNQDPTNKKISFFFCCGQIGGNADAWKRCSCNNGASCINCYRWWDAVSVESVATYGLFANTTNNSDVPDIVFNHSPYNANWDGAHDYTFVDDFAWYGIAYLRVFDWLKVCNSWPVGYVYFH